MRTTIDAAGRLVIPKEIRRAAGLQPGMPLEVSLRDGRIEIEPAPIAVDLVRKGGLLVAVPREPVEPLTNEIVEQTREAILRERFESFL
jgi:AbrB family looped-hinge helix DNA binding protein